MGIIAERIQEAMLARNMKQVDLVRATGIGKSSISTYLSGEYEPKQRNIYKIAHALHVNEAWLMGYDVEMDATNNLNTELTAQPQIAEETITFRAHVDIAAGYDHPAEPLADWEGDSIEVPLSYLRGRPMSDYFVIRIRGNSMYPHYQNGDYVLVLKADALDHSGQIGVLLHRDEGTIKKIEYTPGEDCLKLIPLNPEYMPKVIEGEELDTCRIIGIPKYIIREVE